MNRVQILGFLIRFPADLVALELSLDILGGPPAHKRLSCPLDSLVHGQVVFLDLPGHLLDLLLIDLYLHYDFLHVHLLVA